MVSGSSVRGGGSVSAPTLVDLHTHVFNVRYLPIRRIFSSQIGGPSAGKDLLIALVALLLEQVAGSSFQRGEGLDGVWEAVAEELDQRRRGYLAAAGPERDAKDYLVDRLSDDALFNALFDGEELLVESREDPENPTDQDISLSFQGAFVASERRVTRRSLIANLEGGSDSLSLQTAGWFGRFKAVVRWLVKKLWRLIQHAQTWWSDAADFMTFIHRMLMAELGILKALSSTYPGERLLLVHHMMDMEHGYEPPETPFYQFKEQQSRMLRLQQEADGTLLGFTAFDPRRSDNLALGGFSGFKFYPAMGYRPWNNDSQDVQQRVVEFYKWCCESDHDYPIFAHCTPTGFEASAGSGWNAHPRHWRDALVEYPSLRLCLGHAGGGDLENGDYRSYGWYAANDEQWVAEDNFARIVLDLCRARPNVYCEFGHLHELVEPGSSAVRERFERNFVPAWQDQDADHVFSKKCMFGSDHHMPHMINSAGKLLDYFRSLFDRKKLSGIDDFCVGNALRYLKR
jgi:predicted TIM-barrel fold metal-dependent hydrolase